jgi:hypothetical protein
MEGCERRACPRRMGVEREEADVVAIRKIKERRVCRSA